MLLVCTVLVNSGEVLCLGSRAVFCISMTIDQILGRSSASGSLQCDGKGQYLHSNLWMLLHFLHTGAVCSVASVSIVAVDRNSEEVAPWYGPACTRQPI